MRLVDHLSLRAKLIGAFLLVLLPVLALLLVNFAQDQARRERAVLNSQLQVAVAVANLVDESFDDDISLGQAVAEDSLMQSMDPNLLDPYLQGLVRRTNFSGNISVYNAQGINRGWGDPTQPATPRLTVGEMPYYQPYFDLTLRDNVPTISEVLLLRRPLTVGFIVSVPIRNPQGQPIGVVVLTQRTDQLAARYNALGLMSNQTVLLADPTGRLAFITSHPDLSYDQSAAFATAEPLQRALQGTPAQSTDFVSPIDNDQRIGTFVPTGKYHWVVGVTVPQAVALAPVEQAVRTQAIGFSVIALVSILTAVVLSLLLLAPLGRLKNAVSTVGRGDLSYRLPVRDGDELDQLGASVNQMAAQLERQRDEVIQLLEREEALARIAQALVREVELSQVVHVVIRESISVLHVDAVAVWLADSTKQTLNLLSQHGFSAETASVFEHLSFDAPFLAARAAKIEQPQVVEDVAERETKPEARAIYVREQLHGVLALPLCARGALVGVVEYVTRAPHSFSRRELDFDTTIAGLFAVAIENARLYEQIHDTLRLREDFIAAAAHELRTPITVIKGRSELTLRRDARDEPARSTLQMVVRQSDRIARLADDLLAVVRLRPGIVVLRREVFDLNALVEEVVSQMATRDPDQHFEIHGDGILLVDADRNLVSEAFGDLLEYAERHSPSGSPVEVTVRPEDSSAVVAVTEYGVGIAPERQPFVFEPFYEPVAPGEHGYTGVVSLGLYISKEIISAHGGRIWVTSNPVAGSTIAFSLPLAR